MANVGQIFDFTMKDGEFVTFLQKINSFTDVGVGGVLGLILIIIFGSILFFMMKAFGSERAAVVALFISTFLGMGLRIFELLTDYQFYIVALLWIISVIMLLKNSDQNTY